MNITDLPTKLSARITPVTNGEWDCWEWTGARTKKNYGQVYFDGTTQRVHRLTYRLLVGPIPQGMELHHGCENEPCCNPAHLVVCTSLFNTNQKPDVNKSHCVRGHELTADNTRMQVDDLGHIHRSCKECNRQRKRSAARNWPSRQRAS